MKLALGLSTAAALSLAAASPSHAATVYSNDFSTNANGFTGAAASLQTSPSGEKFLGFFYNGSSATLLLDTYGATSVTLNYDLYAIQTVDGDGPAGGNSPTNPDAFTVAVTGGPTLLDSSFANYNGDTQNYPTPGSAAGTGAVAQNTLGYSAPGLGDTTYAFSSTFAPTGVSTSIVFTGLTNQSLGDESFGIDNVSATETFGAVSGAPEPGTWALMIAGLGVMGLALRRRVGGAVAGA